MGSMEARRSSVVVAGCMLAAIMMCSVVAGVGAQGPLATKCSQEFQKVTACLTYATGKADKPTKECCTAVTDIRGTDPACLCFIIQQAHNGSEQIKSMGIQEPRLLLLPSACSLKNTSISECPKLLGIPPTSPDYAIFTNASAAAAPPAPSGTSSPDTANTHSGAAKQGPQLPMFARVAAAVLLSAFQIGSASNLFGPC